MTLYFLIIFSYQSIVKAKEFDVFTTTNCVKQARKSQFQNRYIENNDNAFNLYPTTVKVQKRNYKMLNIFKTKWTINGHNTIISANANISKV